MRTEPATRAKSANCFVLTSPLGSHKMPLLGRQSPLSRTRRGTSNLGSLGEQILMKAATRLRVHRCFLSAHFLVVVPPVFTLSPTTPSRKVGNPAAFGQGHRAWPGCMPAGATRGATCASVSVACPAVPNLTATPSEASPTGAALGTIILANGGGGTSLFNAGFANAYLANAYLKNGFRVVQLLCASNREDSNGVGVTSAACRPATIPPPPSVRRPRSAALGPLPHSVILERSEQSLARRPQRHRREPRPPLPRFES